MEVTCLKIHRAHLTFMAIGQTTNQRLHLPGVI